MLYTEHEVDQQSTGGAENAGVENAGVENTGAKTHEKPSIHYRNL